MDVQLILDQLDLLEATLDVAIRDERELTAMRLGDMASGHDWKVNFGRTGSSKYQRAQQAISIIRNGLSDEPKEAAPGA